MSPSDALALESSPSPIPGGATGQGRRVSFDIDDHRLPRHLRAKIVVNQATGCWEVSGGRSRDGYALASFRGRTHQVHRVVYALLVGPIPCGLVIDHTCRVRHCANPADLEPVTVLENLRRGNTPAGATRCRKCGGPFSVIGKAHPQRRCLPCRDAYDRSDARRAARRAPRGEARHGAA